MHIYSGGLKKVTQVSEWYDFGPTRPSSSTVHDTKTDLGSPTRIKESGEIAITTRNLRLENKRRRNKNMTRNPSDNTSEWAMG